PPPRCYRLVMGEHLHPPRLAQPELARKRAREYGDVADPASDRKAGRREQRVDHVGEAAVDEGTVRLRPRECLRDTGGEERLEHGRGTQAALGHELAPAVA